MKFDNWVEHRPERNPFNFGALLDEETDPGFIFSFSLTLRDITIFFYISIILTRNIK